MISYFVRYLDSYIIYGLHNCFFLIEKKLFLVCFSLLGVCGIRETARAKLHFVCVEFSWDYWIPLTYFFNLWNKQNYWYKKVSFKILDDCKSAPCFSLSMLIRPPIHPIAYLNSAFYFLLSTNLKLILKSLFVLRELNRHLKEHKQIWTLYSVVLRLSFLNS